MPRKWLALALAIVIAAGVLGIFGGRGGPPPPRRPWSRRSQGP